MQVWHSESSLQSYLAFKKPEKILSMVFDREKGLQSLKNVYLASYQSVAIIDNICKACKLSCLLAFKMGTTTWLICYIASEQVCAWAESETNWKERSCWVLNHCVVPVQISLFLHVVHLLKYLTGLKTGSCNLTFSAYFYCPNEEISFQFETEPKQKCIAFSLQIHN